MPPPFPLTPAPSYYGRTDWFATGQPRCGVFYEGETVEITRNKTDAITYDVYDFFGEIVTSGSTSSAVFQPPEPTGGWRFGWYRLLMSGPTSDPDFGNSYGVTNFCVIRNDSHFVPMPAGDGTDGGDGGEYPDFVMKGVMGAGTQRMQIENADDPTTGADTLAMCVANLALTNTYWVDPGAPYADSVRPRYAFCQFPNGTIDSVLATGFLTFMCADPSLDGSQVFVETVAGSVSGTKVNVYYPDAATLAESYDNLADETTARDVINAASTLIFTITSGGPPPSFLAKTAIGSAFKQGVIDVVSTLYPLGCTYFEGYQNEPSLNWRIINHQMMLFQAYVHEGDPDAKAIGPCAVDLMLTHANPDVGWEPCIAHGLADYCDEISFHAYGDTGPGEINITRVKFGAFLDMLASYGVDKPLWQTESTSINTPVGRVHQPVKAQIPLLQTLLLEQLGIPKERNNYWYDLSHGFWGIPNWLENGDGSLEPHAVLYRVLAEEVWGKTFSQQLDFGTPGNQIFYGSVYTGSAGSVAVISSQSRMPDATVILSISGSLGSVTVVDGFGNSSTVYVDEYNRVTVPVQDIPVYVELPVGITASVHSCNDWGFPGLGPSLQLASTTRLLDGVSTAELGDGEYLSDWSIPIGSVSGTAPTDADLLWSSPINADRVIVWCGAAGTTFIDFDIQTTVNGTVWTTQASVTKTDAVSFRHGVSTENTGTVWETFWDQQWIFDIPISVTGIVGLRVKINDSAYGGDPDLQSGTDNGNTTQTFVMQEIGVYNSLPSVQPGGARTIRRLGRGSAS